MSQQALPRGLALCFPAVPPGLCLRAELQGNRGLTCGEEPADSCGIPFFYLHPRQVSGTEYDKTEWDVIDRKIGL